MMLKYVIFAFLALACASAEEGRVTCNDAAPLDKVEIEKLGGNWVAVELLKFKDGHVFFEETDNVTDVCIYIKTSDVTDHSMKITKEIHWHGQTDFKTEALTMNTIADATNKGRMTLASSTHDRTNWEFMILDYIPNKYLVYMLCQPPNAEGVRLPKRAVLLSRHADHSDHEVTTTEEEKAIEEKIENMLHVVQAERKPRRLNTECWASYAEPAQ